MAANPVGNVTTAGGRHFWAAPFEIDGEFGGQGPDPAVGLGRNVTSRKMEAIQAGTNTTIAIVATDAILTKAQTKRLSASAHDGIGRAILPAHTPFDGDLVFAAATGTVKRDVSGADMLSICHAASLCLSRAIARAVFHATPEENDVLPCWSDHAG